MSDWWAAVRHRLGPRGPEVRAALRWIVRSWQHPAGAESTWEQASPAPPHAPSANPPPPDDAPPHPRRAPNQSVPPR
jgi:hypothetical protein